LSEEERKLFRLYGKLPSNKKDLLKKERKYFDSGDYALSKAGKASVVGVTNIGSQHPLPENIPHIHNTHKTGDQGAAAGGNSPVKEASHLHSKSPMASEEPIMGDIEASKDEDEAADTEIKESDAEAPEKVNGEEKEEEDSLAKITNAAPEAVAVPSQ
ncbi:hypothetical protein EDC01DRAFT_618416, partial [Geopyxis carbonaria]